MSRSAMGEGRIVYEYEPVIGSFVSCLSFLIVLVLSRKKSIHCKVRLHLTTMLRFAPAFASNFNIMSMVMLILTH